MLIFRFKEEPFRVVRFSILHGFFFLDFLTRQMQGGVAGLFLSARAGLSYGLKMSNRRRLPTLQGQTKLKS